ncbi:phospholipase D-like domain-containing protein [Arenibacter sp. S6351L]|uniref:phospholipase D-like domain-containing protein n=1 Tax=Arenibacter sp. S6351L TaxID=2926407 RepID=UPI001FF2164F|nr:phospholipase D-like domain-containing protein [Arenibacter sp. S6351L]MCK0135879.1 phospholipase D-like domain-containing protein [Arenibacter sp. S6351L]
MYFNKAICDIYIGTGAGKKLMEEIENSKRSVKIVSPYLSPFLVKKLLDLHYRGVEVQLITMDTIEDFYGDRQKNIHQLIIQDRSINIDAKTLRLKWINIKRWLYFFLMVMILLLGVIVYSMQDRMVLWGGIPLLLVWLLIRHYTSKIRNAKIYRYSYRQLFPFKVFITPESNSYSHPFVHGKMYLIDDGIAYLGSLNFTGNGTKNNYETRIRITGKNAINELEGEFEALFQNMDYPERELVEWGRELYGEVES